MHKPCLLLVAHGTPSSLDDIPAFLNNIRRGRPTPPSIVQEVRSRYQAIGGLSPVLEITRAQANLAAKQLGMPAFVATRMWHPYFDEVLTQIIEQGFDEVIVVVMAAHSAHVYEAALRESAAKLEKDGLRVPKLNVAPCWGDNDSLIECYKDICLKALETIQDRNYTLMITSAHSLPMRAVSSGDPYPELVRTTANKLVQALGTMAPRHTHAFQSQGMSQEAWLGPDLPTTFDQARNDGFRQVLIVPVGFLADHVETLFDLDIEAKHLAEERGLGFTRCPCPNLHERLIQAVVETASALRNT